MSREETPFKIHIKTVKTKDFEKYRAVEKEKTVSGIIPNIDRKDMCIEMSKLKKHFIK